MDKGAHCPRVSVVLADVIDTGEPSQRLGAAAALVSRLRRAIKTTYPKRRHIPQRMMEDAWAQRNRSFEPRAQAALSLTHPDAAGIDIGSASHCVAVPPDRDDEPVREFKFDANHLSVKPCAPPASAAAA